jgi:hypothetical protein
MAMIRIRSGTRISGAKRRSFRNLRLITLRFTKFGANAIQKNDYIIAFLGESKIA